MSGEVLKPQAATRERERDDRPRRNDSWTNRALAEAYTPADGRNKPPERSASSQPRDADTQANKDLDRLINEGKNLVGFNGKPRIEESPVTAEEKKFGIAKSILVHGDGGSDLSSPGWKGTVRHSFNAKGERVRFDYLDNNGKFIANKDNKDLVNSYLKINGEWKQANFKTGQWDKLALQGHDFSNKTGDMTCQHSAETSGIYGADGSVRQIITVPGPNKGRESGKVVIGPNGKVSEIERPEEKWDLKYKTVKRANGKIEQVLEAVEVSTPKISADGTKTWEKVATYKDVNGNGKNFSPDKSNLSPMVNLSIDARKGSVHYEDGHGKYDLHANGQRFNDNETQYEYNQLGQRTAIIPPEKDRQNGAVKYFDITYDNAGKVKTYRAEKQVKETLEGGLEARRTIDATGQTLDFKVLKEGKVVGGFRKDNRDGGENIFEYQANNQEIKWTRQRDGEWNKFEKKEGDWNLQAAETDKERVYSLAFNDKGVKTWVDGNKSSHTRYLDNKENTKFANGFYTKKDSSGKVIESGLNGKPQLTYEHKADGIFDVFRPSSGRRPEKIAEVKKPEEGQIRDDGAFEHKDADGNKLVESPNGSNLKYRAKDGLLAEVTIPGGGKATYTYGEPPIATSPDLIVYTAPIRTKKLNGIDIDGVVTRTLKKEPPVLLANGTPSPVGTYAETASLSYPQRGARPDRANFELTSNPPPQLHALKLDQANGNVEGISDGQRYRFSTLDMNHVGKDAIKQVQTPSRYEHALTDFREVFRHQFRDEIMRELRIDGDNVTFQQAREIEMRCAYGIAKNQFPDQFPNDHRESPVYLLDPRNSAEYTKISKRDKAKAALILELAAESVRQKEGTDPIRVVAR